MWAACFCLGIRISILIYHTRHYRKKHLSNKLPPVDIQELWIHSLLETMQCCSVCSHDSSFVVQIASGNALLASGMCL